MTTLLSPTAIKIADEVWIIVALLHREHPEQPDFSIEDIVAKAHDLALVRPLRPGFYVHVVQHCVANRAPNPGRYRVLFETSAGRRRLFRRGDAYHPQREGSKVLPTRSALPQLYRNLLDWYEEWSSQALRSNSESDPLLRLRGSGRKIWRDEHADAYVSRLRREWQ
jgi:hypothetical protein